MADDVLSPPTSLSPVQGLDPGQIPSKSDRVWRSLTGDVQPGGRQAAIGFYSFLTRARTTSTVCQRHNLPANLFAPVPSSQLWDTVCP